MMLDAMQEIAVKIIRRALVADVEKRVARNGRASGRVDSKEAIEAIRLIAVESADVVLVKVGERREIQRCNAFVGEKTAHRISVVRMSRVDERGRAIRSAKKESI